MDGAEGGRAPYPRSITENPIVHDDIPNCISLGDDVIDQNAYSAFYVPRLAARDAADGPNGPRRVIEEPKVESTGTARYMAPKRPRACESHDNRRAVAVPARA